MTPILILHGWGSCAKNWQRVKELLEKEGYKVYVPDLPGFGQNPPPPSPWSIDDYVEWVRDFCEKQGLSWFFLLGHSFGGGVAVKYALKYPANIKKLFLVAPAIIRKKTFKKEIFRKISAFLPKPLFLRKIFYKIFFPKSDYLHTQGIMKETYLRVVKEDLSNDLSYISIPAVIIWGQKDDVLPVEDAYFIKDKIKNSKLLIIPASDHDLEQKVPELLTQKIEEFIQ